MSITTNKIIREIDESQLVEYITRFHLGTSNSLCKIKWQITSDSEINPEIYEMGEGLLNMALLNVFIRAFNNDRVIDIHYNIGNSCGHEYVCGKYGCLYLSFIFVVTNSFKSGNDFLPFWKAVMLNLNIFNQNILKTWLLNNDIFI
jgi:hypothetical protein